MSTEKHSLFLVVALTSVVLLLALIVVVVSPTKVAETFEPLAALAPSAKAVPSNFGRLDEAVPFAGGIAPVAADVEPAEAHASEFRDGAWLRSQNQDSYTVQVMAARDESAIKRFLSEHAGQHAFSYFVSTIDGLDWYVLVTGSFGSRELASGVADSTDYGVSSKAFAKRFGAYQSAQKIPPSAAPAVPAPAPVVLPAVAPVAAP